MTDDPDLPPAKPEAPRIAVVGPCAAGKSTLTRALKASGYPARQPAQEHSLVPDMWRRMSRPDLLIYLDVDYASARQRRPRSVGEPERLAAQRQRLQHARQHCDFYLDTSDLTPQEVWTAVQAFLASVIGNR